MDKGPESVDNGGSLWTSRGATGGVRALDVDDRRPNRPPRDARIEPSTVIAGPAHRRAMAVHLERRIVHHPATIGREDASTKSTP